MRAATRTGFTFVGGHVGSAQATAPAKNNFQPKVIRPDLQAQEQKKFRYKAFQLLAKSLNELMTTATDEREIQFWQEHITRLKGFGV
ncbi:MAG: hypothetical protein Q8M94_01560 [Ignavibacteria bacterium]|nr:hypothetical protein [Ignavibacteria bacterium]